MNEIRSEVIGRQLVVYVHGIIGGDVLGSELARILDQVRPDDIDEVVFDVYSPGGSVWEGNLITAKLRELSERGIRSRAKVYAAASMATILAVSAERAEIAANGRWLIHNPWTTVIGDAAELEKAAKELAATQDEAAEIYSMVTGRSKDDILGLMAEERWMTAAEALEWGFVDAIIAGTDSTAYASVRETMLATPGLPQMVVDFLAEESHVPAEKPEPAGEAVPAAAEPVPADDGQQNAVQAGEVESIRRDCAEWQRRAEELGAENGKLAGQVAELRAEADRKEAVIQDLRRRLQAFGPAVAGADEDRANGGAGDPKAYWRHVADLKAAGMPDEQAHLEAARRWPDDHRAMIVEATRHAIR